MKKREIILVEELKERSITEVKEVKHMSEQEPCWMDLVEGYLHEGTLLASKKEARTIIRKALRYTIINGQLYKRSFSTPYLW